MKQTHHYPFKSLKKIIIAFAIFLVPFSSSAQNTDSYKTFINNTGFAVFEVQKAVMANNLTNLNGSLANLMQLQMNAVALFNKKDYTLAAYTANLSRAEAIKLLIKLNGDANKFYTVSDEERKLFASVNSQADVARAKQTNSTFSAKDEDYLNPGQFAKKIMIE